MKAISLVELGSDALISEYEVAENSVLSLTSAKGGENSPWLPNDFLVEEKGLSGRPCSITLPQLKIIARKWKKQLKKRSVEEKSSRRPVEFYKAIMQESRGIWCNTRLFKNKIPYHSLVPHFSGSSLSSPLMVSLLWIQAWLNSCCRVCSATAIVEPMAATELSPLSATKESQLAKAKIFYPQHALNAMLILNNYH